MRLAASQFSGESSFGFYNKYLIALHKASNVQVGLHSFFIMSKQTSPDTKWMFGWKIFVLKNIFGGIMGYSELRLILTKNMLPS